MPLLDSRGMAPDRNTSERTPSGETLHTGAIATFFSSLLKSYAPPSILFNDEGNIIYIHGRTGAYLEPTAGPTGHDANLFRMVRPGLRQLVDQMVHEAMARGTEIIREGVRVQADDGVIRTNLRVRRLGASNGLKKLLLLTFEPAPPDPPPPPSRERAGCADGKWEPTESQADLHKANEELDTTNEELKVANEELQVTNEELQRTIEELKASEKALEGRTEALVAHRHRLQHLASELTLAEHRERRRLASELHDYLAQMLIVARLKLDCAMVEKNPATATADLAEIGRILGESSNYTRSLIAELSPQVLYQAGLPAALKWLGEQMQRHGLHVDVRTSVDTLRVSDSIATITFQCIRELLFNVLKHAGVPTARLVLTRHERHLEVVVSDHGRGTDPMAALSGHARATHFGLFSIRERLEAMGGRFEFHSTLGQGTDARLIVPVLEENTLGKSDLFRPAAAGQLEPTTRASTEKIRILLVDDHAMVREGLRALLDAYPNIDVVAEGADGDEAVALVKAVNPDVVILDVNMPKMNGIEAARHIKRAYPSIGVIGISAHEEAHIQEALTAAGAMTLISKARASEQLYHAVLSACREG